LPVWIESVISAQCSERRFELIRLPREAKRQVDAVVVIQTALEADRARGDLESARECHEPRPGGAAQQSI
jgi:hypothetical protein